MTPIYALDETREPFDGTEMTEGTTAQELAAEGFDLGGTRHEIPRPKLIDHRGPLVEAPLIGANGNVFAVLGVAARALRAEGYTAEAEAMSERVQSSGSYEQALGIITEYVEPIGVET